jgi:hypothetical protein
MVFPGRGAVPDVVARRSRSSGLYQARIGQFDDDIANWKGLMESN